jgi:methylated-DNA-[protein]-cysteine S-methyltransferase
MTIHSISIFSTTVESPLGAIRIDANADAILGVYFSGQRWEPAPIPDAQNEHTAIIRQCSRQLNEYFSGNRNRFDLPLAPQGTPFQQSVWQQIASIESGALLSYGTIAQRIGRPSASRAVGAATGRNPISIIIPCHRVVGASGQLTGYAGGLDRKTFLLKLESPQQCELKM